jgi:hypothetical protein
VATVSRKVFEMHDGQRIHQFFLCDYVSGEPHLPDHAPEALLHDETNRFSPCWVDIGQLDDLPFIYWAPIKDLLTRGLSQGFPGTIEIVTTPQNR